MLESFKDEYVSNNIIKPTEEESCSGNIIDVYDSLCRFRTIAHVLKTIGKYEYIAYNDCDFETVDYLHRIYNNLYYALFEGKHYIEPR